MSRLEEIAARVAAATPGPWRPSNDDLEDVVVWGLAKQWVANVGDWGDLSAPVGLERKHVTDAHAADAAFIAAARIDVPFLLAEVERLRDLGLLRDYIRSNMFDGDEGGRVTMDIDKLLDEIVECAAIWRDHE